VVFLNADSRLTYSQNFTDTLRKVRLHGEAYFEVSEDKLRPFIVEAGHVQVEALGTAFNVKARKDQPVDVALEEGSVKVYASALQQQVLLEPGEGTSYHPDLAWLTKSTFDREAVTGWKDGIILFKEATIDEVFVELQRWYGVRFTEPEPVLMQKHFNGRFQNESLHNVLVSLSFAMDFNFEIKGNEVIITNNVPM
jgi:ferric-dicitrate binding protein FerR (iron transport regulator)